VPYIGAVPVSPSSDRRRWPSSDSTQFAYQAILGVGYNIDPQFRVNLDARYYGTTSPNLGATPTATTTSARC
jgi:opacity protein-like surface antigen